jgi:cell division protein FtsB
MTTNRTSHPAISSRKEWSVSYTQSDVETIREQIQQEQSAKRRLLLLALVVIAGALVGAIVLLSTSYGLYSRSLSQRQALSDENSGLKAQAAECNQQLADLKQKQVVSDQTRADARARLQKILPAALAPSGGGHEASTLASMVYSLPAHQIEVDRKPPNTLFRNWRVKVGEVTTTYALVGGFVDGKWVIYSNLIARSSDR